MDLCGLVSLGSADRLSGEQFGNLKKVLEASRKFHLDAGIPFPENNITESALVFESGHQPNYIPYAGTFRKAFLIDRLKNKNPDSVSLFGFADYNISTAQVLFKNKLPALNKTGSMSIGFNINKHDRWKLFNLISKPSKEDYLKQLTEVREHYGLEKKELDSVFLDCFERATNFADLNAFLYARICNLLGVRNVSFFRYTDIQSAGLFLHQYEKIISNLDEYNKVHNALVSEKKIEDLKPVESDITPFWQHCSCGCKVMLRLSSGVLSGSCLVCNKEHSFPVNELGKHMPVLSLNAVARNIVYANGLRTSLFISGAGGSLRYGLVSDGISKSLKLHSPITLAWKGRDYYSGRIQSRALYDFKKTFSIDTISDKESVSGTIDARASELKKLIAESKSDKKLLQKYSGQLSSLEVQRDMYKELFSLVPSFLDELYSLESVRIIKNWTEAIDNLAFSEANGFYVAKRDVVFNDGFDEVSRIIAEI